MSQVSEIVDRLGEIAKEAGVALSRAPDPTQKWLRKNSGLPQDLIRILSDSWPIEDASIGVYDLWSLDHLSESERSKIAFGGGFFPIGGAGNGDLLVVRRTPGEIDNCEIGLISHEQLWEKESDLLSIYEPICHGFMTLLNKASIKDALPLDFYDARERTKHMPQHPAGG